MGQHVPKSDEHALMAALNIGPVAIAIEPDKSAFQGYHGGVLDNPACGQQLDHAVLLVAYGSDYKDYWKIKNSWDLIGAKEGTSVSYAARTNVVWRVMQVIRQES